MGAPVVCFLLEPTGRTRVSLRRYSDSTRPDVQCPVRSYHNAQRFLEEIDADQWRAFSQLQIPHDDPRWPTVCDGCNYQFTHEDNWQLFTEHIYRRADTGVMVVLAEAPAGAMWYADWMLCEGSNFMRGPDNRCLYVRTPGGGEWSPDQRASNCTMPHDNEHKCWVRHGTPPKITVDKNGKTCSAGAGSILSRGWHGFLRDGKFVDA